MHIRTFQAPTLQEALAEIRRQMGSDATVLHTRDVHRGMFGWFGKSHVEVTAGLKPKAVAASQNQPGARTSNNPTDRSVEPSATLRPFTSQPDKREQAVEVRQLSKQLERLTQVVQSLEQRQMQPSSTARSTVPGDNDDVHASIVETLAQLGIAEPDARWI